MHDGHVHGSCDDCVSFVPVFPGDRALEAWGYCREDRPAPPPGAVLAALHSAYREGDRAALRENTLGLYRTEPDDACDFYRLREL